MKKILAAQIVIIVFANFIYAQQVNTEWVINNFPGFPVGVMIGLDANDNVFVTGHSGDFTKIITTKYDQDGNLLWERFFSVQDLGVAATWLSVDSFGNIIVTGYARTFSSNPVEVGLLTLKYDNNGNLLWSKLISGTWAFTVRSIVDPSGNIYVTGRAWQYTATYDFVTVKYAPDGTQLWFDTFDQASGFHTPTSMELDQSNNLFITGTGQSGGLITVMYNSNGERQWVREEMGTAGLNIKVDNNGGIFITGSYYDVNTGTSNDIRLIKYDCSGNLLWQKFYDFGNSEFGRLVNIDSQSNILITGFDDLPGEFPGWLTVKLDPSGNLLWYNRFKLNQTWEEFPSFALIGPQDELYVTGNVGVPSGGTTYHGLETVRYNSDGSNLWVADINLYGGIGKGLALGADMSLYAVGMFYYSVLKYSQSSPTPVELSSFIGTVNNSTVELSWTTASEVNNRGFEVEKKNAKWKSEEGKWEKIGFVNGNGTTTETQLYSFVDEILASGKYLYRLKQIDFDGTFEYSNEVEVIVSVPEKFDLSQNYPNPFNPATTISFTIQADQLVSLKVFNSLGQEVRTLINNNLAKGTHNINFNADGLSSGLYLYKLESGNQVQVRKMMVLK
jgi:hypothetical protein